MSRRVIIAGGTGLIGRALSRELASGDYEVVVLTRRAARQAEGGITYAQWDAVSSRGWLELADGAHAIVNLAGYSIASGRWSHAVKLKILDSRLGAGRAVSEAIELSKIKPSVVVQASAIGWYGEGGDEPLDESAPAGDTFLADVTSQWEGTTAATEKLGVRRAVIRTSLVLDREAEFVRRVSLPFRYYIGGPQGSGRQWVSWIHSADEARAIRFLIEREDLSGAFNLSAPDAVTNSDFYKALGTAMGRPSWLRVPAFALRLAFGEMADELILSSKRIIPSRLREHGFEFMYPDLRNALREIFDT
jgi:uncharacterized protein (TIGR01777 family)